MGRRSINTTKSGKYMNPTDQARKEARKKELKKNKKQRQLVRAAVLKGKDPLQLILDMESIDEMEYDVDNPPLLNEKVLKDKRKKLRETLERVMRLYEKEDREYWLELRKKLVEYEKARDARIKYFESVKNALQVQVDEIPLPAMEAPDTVDMSFMTLPGDIPLPVQQPHSILKKGHPDDAKKMRKPPGVPPGPPPSLSDDEGSDNEPYDPEKEVEDSSKSKAKKLRFADSEDTSSKDELSKYSRLSEQPPGLGPPPILYRNMPPMPRQNMPPLPMRPNLPPLPARPNLRFPPPPPIRLPPGPPPMPHPRMMRMGMPPPGMGGPSQQSSVVSAPPMMVSNAKKDQDNSSWSATIEAKPQIRNLNADVTRFLPTSLRVKREEKGKKREEVVPSVHRSMTSVTGALKDDAYEQFMKEMEDLL